MVARLKSTLLSIWQNVGLFCIAVEMNDAENVYRRLETLERKVAELEAARSCSNDISV